jgi:hypothetical protein
VTGPSEVVAALGGWVARLAHLGAAVVPRLRPGADAHTIARVAARHGFTLTEEGSDARVGDRWSQAASAT